MADIDLQRFPVANYIVFRDALRASLEDTKQRLQEARRETRQHGIEPVFMMDEEGGRVTQISDFFPSAPSAAAVSRHLEEPEAGALYSHVAEALADIGIDINLAPCVDVNTEPMNPIIGSRAFGRERESVEQYSRAFIKASKRHTGCVAKHFPGHGMTTADSHRDLPAVETLWEDLESTHIAPFMSAVKAGADGVMIGHCHYTALDRTALPASLSRVIIGDLLRRDLAFKGLVITDSLDMDAVTRSRDPGDVSRSALSAGADILLYTEKSLRFVQAFETLTADLVSGKIHRSRLMESISRREDLLGRIPSRPTSRRSVSRERYLELRERVMTACVDVDDPKGLLPLENTEFTYVTTDHGLMERNGRFLGGIKQIGSGEEARGRALLLWLMEPLKLRYSPEALRGMVAEAERSILVTSYRSLADTLSACDTTLLTYDTSPDTQTSIIRRLFGKEER
jgi:beta-N-acetylhexosaminidase